VKRRALAKELCEEGCVLVNGRTARPGHDLDCGDEVTLNLRNRSISVSVEELPDRAPEVASARSLYRVIREEKHGGDEDGE
jgi:ribosomal 50S subunit-recycling heat shock protein